MFQLTFVGGLFQFAQREPELAPFVRLPLLPCSYLSFALIHPPSIAPVSAR